MNNASQIHIGTSGWYYKHWVGTFYPEHFKSADFLEYYSREFKTVEVNNTFYRLPDEKMVNHWCDSVDEDFIFAVKGSRFITHLKRLKDIEKASENFFERIKLFGDKLGPVLFQLPPNFEYDFDRLKKFIDILPKDNIYAFEFRDHSWLKLKVFDLLSDNNIAFCIYYMSDFVTPRIITADFVYIRLHSPLQGGLFGKEELQRLTSDIKRYVEKGNEVYCYFNNDWQGFAVQNALELKKMLDIV